MYFQSSAVTSGRILSATARYDASADTAAAIALTAAMPTLISVALTEVIVPRQADGIAIREPSPGRAWPDFRLRAWTKRRWRTRRFGYPVVADAMAQQAIAQWRKQSSRAPSDKRLSPSLAVSEDPASR
jgi:hypothetical protein